MVNFKDLGIHQQFIKALDENNITVPTEIQQKAIPFLLENNADFIGKAQTGTGKTAAFGLPMLQKVNPDNSAIQGLILCPTRELGQQIAKQLFKFTKYAEKRIFTEAVYGGEKIDLQIARLKRATHIVVATPGRLIDLLERKAINLKSVKTVVLDEADEMLNMGFKQDIFKILSQLGVERNVWLFSATIQPGIQEIIGNYMLPDAYKVEVSKNQIVNTSIKHQFVTVDEKDKIDVLKRYLQKNEGKSGIVFCRTKNGAQALSKQLFARGIKNESIHGDLGQRDRDRVMRLFKSKRLNVLIATDISARGIDVDNLAFVVHFQLPDQLEYYTHRSGRTARAGNKGISLALIGPNNLDKINEIESILNISFEDVSGRF